jgi:diguanylate cyclase (GGDEF)-like protein/putative nucleotidyltransferase with HDIG domain
MNPMESSISKATRIYWMSVISLGLMVLSHSIHIGENLAQGKPFYFFFYLVGAICLSNTKLVLPGVRGTVSIAFLFVFAAMLDFQLGTVLVIAMASILAQSILGARSKPRWERVLFNLMSIDCAIFLAKLVVDSPVLRSIDPSRCLGLMVGAIVYFQVNTSTVSAIIGLTEQKNPITVWRQYYLWGLPQYVAGASVICGMHLLAEFVGWRSWLLVAPPLILLHRSYTVYLKRLAEEQQHSSQLSSLHWRAIEALALAIDAKDETTYQHLRRVQVYASQIGKELGLSTSELEALDAAALLHDIGKLAVPEHIISKPGRLTQVEFEKVKIHPVVGAEILERVQFPYPVVPIVRSHHEKFDGTGYPDGLAGDEIPIGARILSAVDCLDALASDRQYRKALPLSDAMDVISRQSGTSFDPVIVNILKRRFRELEQMAQAVDPEVAKLSTNARIERGLAPATGFADAVEEQRPCAKQDFTLAIASARQEFQTLLEITNDLGNSLSVDETLSVLAARLKPIVPHDLIAIYLCVDGKLVPQLVKGENARAFSSVEVPLGDGLSGWVADENRPILNGNPSVEPALLGDTGKGSRRLLSAVSVPLEGAAGVAGVLSLYSVHADAFTQDHLRLLVAISAKAGLTIENAMQYCQAHQSAVTDELTGLPNFRSLLNHLKLEIARSAVAREELTVLLMDLNGFKAVNDRLGHLTGNRLLQGVATALRSCCRETDYVARLGGDEFVITVPNLKGGELDALTQRLHRAVAATGILFCGEDDLSVSIGNASLLLDGNDAETLLALADQRMYEAKRDEANRKARYMEMDPTLKELVNY